MRNELDFEFKVERPTVENNTKVNAGDVVRFDNGVSINGVSLYNRAIDILVKDGDETVQDVMNRLSVELEKAIRKAVIQFFVSCNK